MLKIGVSVEKIGSKSLTYRFDFQFDDNSIATGKVVAVCCHVHPKEPLQSTLIPADLRGRLEPFLRANL